MNMIETPLERMRREKAELEEQSLTPMQRQYREAKKQYPDVILLVRIGDFLEAFWDDAKLLAKTANVALTRRGTVPMAGIPCHAAGHYASAINAQGYRVQLIDLPKP